MYQELDLESGFFPLYGNTIVIPENSVFWRGYLREYPLSSRPAYFGTEETAKIYGDTYNAFTNSRPLRLLDIRFLKVILRQLFQDNRSNKKLSPTDLQTIQRLSTSFGLFSLKKQVENLKQIYEKFTSLHALIHYIESTIINESPIEQPGIRVGETSLDGFTMEFLKKLFHPSFVHGFISPRMISPFHVEKRGIINPEIILFNPEASGIQLLANPPKNMPKVSIERLITKHHPLITIEHGDFVTDFHMGGDGEPDKETGIKIHPLDEFYILLENGDKNIKKLYTDAQNSGQRWNTKLSGIKYYEPPHPTVPLHFFNK